MSEIQFCKGCSGTCCTGVGSDPCTCPDMPEKNEEQIALLLKASSRLNELAQSLYPPFQDLADPVAEWLKVTASELSWGSEVNDKVLAVALNVAQKIVGDD